MVLETSQQMTDIPYGDYFRVECKDILCKSVSWEQPVFLALDNLWDGTESIEHAKMFLHEAAFPEGSVVMVTARTLTTLGYLGIYKSQCFEVPQLSKVDARKLFLYHAANGREFGDDDDIDIIDRCVSRCYFQKSEKQGCHYLPLAVRVLGIHMGSLGSDPKQWLESLERLKNFDLFRSKEENPVFGVLRLNYDRLTPEDQELFMDIACYFPRFDGYDDDNSQLREWLGLIHRKKWEEIGVQLQLLEDNGLLEDVDVSSGEFSIHDVYLEFAQLEVDGKLTRKGESFQSRRFFNVNSHPSELEKEPSGRVWGNLFRVSLEEEFRHSQITSLKVIRWKYYSNVIVLKLWGLGNLKGVLNLGPIRCLRSLELQDLEKLGGVEGLEDLGNLAHFQWVSYHGEHDESQWVSDDKFENGIRPRLGHLPESLEVLRVEGVEAVVGRDVIARCSNLRNLKLTWIRAHDGIDFTKCSSLLTLHLWSIEGLHDGIDFTQCSSLLTLHLWRIQGLQELTGLRTECLQSLEIGECDDLRDASGIEHSVGLQEMFLRDLRNLNELPSLSRLQHLRSGCSQLTGLEGVGDLPSLRDLDLRFCSSLVRLPELSKCTNLEKLDLSYCFSLLRLPELSKCSNLEKLDIMQTGMELGEEDIVMLSKLPKLRPVRIAYSDRHYIELDVVKRRVLKGYEELSIKRSWVLVKERDLETPPIKILDYKF